MVRIVEKIENSSVLFLKTSIFSAYLSVLLFLNLPELGGAKECANFQLHSILYLMDYYVRGFH